MCKTAREFNALLLEHGFLEGTPGNYAVTEKGAPFAHYKDEFRGNPRSLSYSAQWSTRSWDDDIISVLEREMADPHFVGASDAAALSGAPAPDVAAASNFVPGDVHAVAGDGGRRTRLLVAGAVVGVVASVVVARNPRAQRWVRGTAQPGAKKLWRRATRRDRACDPTADNHVHEDSSVGVVYPQTITSANAVTEADGHPRCD